MLLLQVLSLQLQMYHWRFGATFEDLFYSRLTCPRILCIYR
jgi:hypothetical protein